MIVSSSVDCEPESHAQTSLNDWSGGQSGLMPRLHSEWRPVWSHAQTSLNDWSGGQFGLVPRLHSMIGVEASLVSCPDFTQ